MDLQGNKTGGRQKGTPNRTTTELREMITTLFESKYEAFTSALDELEPKDKVDAYFKLMSFILPRQKEVAMEVKDHLDDIEIVLHPLQQKKFKTRPSREDCTPEELEKYYHVPQFGYEEDSLPLPQTKYRPLPDDYSLNDNFNN
jgi:hypothetical protein